MKKRKSSEDKWLEALVAVFAIFLLRSIFENDNSKIVSQKGQETLSDSNKMGELEKRLHEAESKPSENKEVTI